MTKEEVLARIGRWVLLVKNGKPSPLLQTESRERRQRIKQERKDYEEMIDKMIPTELTAYTRAIRNKANK